MNFKYSVYSEYLDFLYKNNYVSNITWILDPSIKKTIYLRHDVDILPEFCIDIATIEERYNYRSSFFFLESNGLYSLYDQVTRSVIGAS